MTDDADCDIDPRWLEPPYRPEWDRDPPWRREDRTPAARPGLASVKPDESKDERRAG